MANNKVCGFFAELLAFVVEAAAVTDRPHPPHGH
jgi:hypothetical protein